MRSFFYSSTMLAILAVLLVLVFFLPDLIGPLPAVLLGTAVVGLAFFTYDRWCKVDGTADGKTDDRGPQNGAGEDSPHGHHGRRPRRPR